MSRIIAKLDREAIAPCLVLAFASGMMFVAIVLKVAGV